MQKQKFKGRWLYMGWSNPPWRLVVDNGEIDLWPIIDKFLTSLNGKRADHKQERDGYTLAADKSSEFQFKYVPGEYILLEKPENIGVSNVHAYLDNALVWLSGRMVEIEIQDGKQIKFTADKSEKVFGVYFVDGNSCEIPDGAEKTVCKIGQSDCCIFLLGTTNGFQCGKFGGSIARMLLDRLAKGEMRSSRIGNCAILGRKEQGVATA